MSGIVTTTLAAMLSGFSSQKSSNSNKSDSTVSEYIDVVNDDEMADAPDALDAMDMDNMTDDVSGEEPLPQTQPPLSLSALSQPPAGLSAANSHPDPEPQSVTTNDTSPNSIVPSDCSGSQPIPDPQPAEQLSPDSNKQQNHPQNMIRNQIIQADSSDLTVVFTKMGEYCDVIDDLEGVNNYAPEALSLSNKCRKVETAGCFLQHPFQKVMNHIEHTQMIQDEVPEVLPVPNYFVVPEHMRTKKAPVLTQPIPQSYPKHNPGKILSDPEIEEISFISNKKKDGDMRNYLISGNSESKTVPQTSNLQNVTSSRPAAPAIKIDDDDDDDSESRYPYKSRGGTWGKRGNSGGNRQWGSWKKGRWGGRRNQNDDDDEDAADLSDRFKAKETGFISGRELHNIMQAKKNDGVSLVHTAATAAVTKGFVNPVPGQQRPQPASAATLSPGDQITNVEDHLVQRVLNEIVVPVQNVCWDDIAGLQREKERIEEVVVYPLLKPGIFTGIRAPSKGLLLFGPPGTGKSMIGKCIASQSKATFFSVSSSSLTSKWIGEGEKLVRAMFAVARNRQPSVIFIDEIDSLLGQRSDQDHEASIRLKTEFLMQFEGVTSSESDRLLVVGATNRPDALDDAARRRFDKRLMIGLPDDAARSDMVRKHMIGVDSNLNTEDLTLIASMTSGYSGSDMKIVCKEAAMGPIRSAKSAGIFSSISRPDELRPVEINDFKSALREVRPSVGVAEVERHEEFNRQFGALGL